MDLTKWLQLLTPPAKEAPEIPAKPWKGTVRCVHILGGGHGDISGVCDKQCCLTTPDRNRFICHPWTATCISMHMTVFPSSFTGHSEFTLTFCVQWAQGATPACLVMHIGRSCCQLAKTPPAAHIRQPDVDTPCPRSNSLQTSRQCTYNPRATGKLSKYREPQSSLTQEKQGSQFLIILEGVSHRLWSNICWPG